MYHAGNGWFFERMLDGSVDIQKHETSDLNSPLVVESTIPENLWASAVASVSLDSELNEGWYQALEFHNEREHRGSHNEFTKKILHELTFGMRMPWGPDVAFLGMWLTKTKNKDGEHLSPTFFEEVNGELDDATRAKVAEMLRTMADNVEKYNQYARPNTGDAYEREEGSEE